MTPASIQDSSEPEGGQRVDALGALRLPNFRWLLAGTTLSNGAQWVQQVTLSWLVYDVTGSGALLGTLSLVRAVATLGLAPVAGVAIDRLPRRSLLFAANGWLFAICLLLGLALLGGSQALWPLFVFTFLVGLAQAVELPLRQTVVFALVPRPLAPVAMALIQTGWAVMRSLGPALGGFFILWFGPAGNFFIQAGAYALITLTIGRLRFPAEQRARARVAARAHLVESLRFVANERLTRAFLLMSMVLPLLIIPIFAALPPIYAKDVFHGGPQVLGALLSATGVGGIVGGLVTAALGRFERRGVLQLGALLLLSLSLFGFACTADLWVALALLALAGFFEMVFLTTNQTLLQLAIPDELRGRITSLASLSAGLAPLGAFVAGVGADVVGPQLVTQLMSGTAALLAVVVFAASPTIRNHRLSQALT